MSGQNKLIKVAVYSANSKWDKQLKPVDVQRVNVPAGSGTSTGDAVPSWDSHQRTSNSGGGRGASSATGSKPKKPKKRPSTRCEATACGEDLDCCENYRCLTAVNAHSDTMELAWGVQRFFQHTVLSWCLMSTEQVSSG